MGRRDRHEAIAARLLHRLLPGAHQRIVGARERHPVHDDQLAVHAGDVDALPEREGAEQARTGVRGEGPDELAQRLLALEQDRHVEPAAHRLRRALGGTHRGEQAQRPAAGGLHQLRQLVEHVGAAALPAGLGEVLGDVEDALLGVVEGRPDVDALPLRYVVAPGALGGEAQRRPDAVEVPAELEGGRGQHHGSLAEELLPQQPGHRQRSHPQGGPEPVVALVPDDVVLGAFHDALRDRVDVLHGGERLLAHGVLVLDRLVPRGADRRDHRARSVTQ